MTADTTVDARSPILVFDQVSKFFHGKTALDKVTLSIPPSAIVGVIGRNGCGKSTLLHHATGLMLPSRGVCRTFGVPSDALGASHLARIGVVYQHAKLLGWMCVSDLAAYIGTFYATWDRPYVASLLQRLLLPKTAKVSTLSPGSVQALSLLLALGHRPDLLLLDEPLSDLDPTARAEALAILLEYFADRPCTVLISSHLLHDIEPVINHVICLDRGRVTADDELDALKEAYEEVLVTANDVALPLVWDGPGLVRAHGDARSARLVLRGEASARAMHIQQLTSPYRAHVSTRPLNLEQLFPLLTDVNDVPR